MSFVLPPNTKKINFEKSEIKDEVKAQKKNILKTTEKKKRKIILFMMIIIMLTYSILIKNVLLLM